MTPAPLENPRSASLGRENEKLPIDERWHYVALIFVSLLVGILFLQEPGFGDELTYWRLAFGLHHKGAAAWSAQSFHALRWPLWGVSWLWQGVFGAGLASYYCAPLFYLVAAACLAFAFGKIVLRSVAGAWVCATALLFHPVLDVVFLQPLPDLSESVFDGCAVLAWWTMMRAEKTRGAWIFGALSGTAIGLAFANRSTGILIAPVLAVATLLLFPRRWKWLLVPGLFVALFFAIECAVYQRICGDWLHSLHANSHAENALGTEPMALWKLPVRFLDAFWKGNRIAPVFAVLGAGGLWLAWQKKHGAAGRLVALWFGGLFLLESCAVQSLHPVRPLLGHSIRYIAATVIPLSVLVGCGAFAVAGAVARLGWMQRVRSRPWIAGVVGFAALAAGTSRPFFSLGFVPDFRRYMHDLSDGTRIFTHESMYDLACLADGSAVRRFVWDAPRQILNRDPALEARARACDQFWYAHKLAWLVQRKAAEKAPGGQPPLASYFAAPEADWQTERILAQGDNSDFVFARRRTRASPAPSVFAATDTRWKGLLPTLPAEWSRADRPTLALDWQVPPEWRGKFIRLEPTFSSASLAPVTIRLEFRDRARALFNCTLKPVIYAMPGQDFFALEIPAAAETCAIKVEFNKTAKAVRLLALRAVVESPP